jgi:hypothetical protein
MSVPPGGYATFTPGRFEAAPNVDVEKVAPDWDGILCRTSARLGAPVIT